VLFAVRKPIIFGEHHADGVEDRIMAVEPFADQALRDSTRRRFISERASATISTACGASNRIRARYRLGSR